MCTVEGCSETRLFRHLSNHVFRSLKFRKHISYKAYLLFQRVQRLMQISEMQEKRRKKFLFAFKLVAVDSLYFKQNILTNSPKVSDITKREIFQLNFSQSGKTR